MTGGPTDLIPGICRHCGHSWNNNAHPNGTGRCVARLSGDEVCGCLCSYITEAEAGVPW